VRVVAGIARGRRLQAPKGDATRPTSDFVREAIFNSLQAHLDLDPGPDEGTTVLDLFAGTGALGIEALSRGATHATFVDHDRLAVAAIRANLAATGFADRATVVQADVTRPATALPSVDLAFADPPYAFTDAAWAALLARVDAALLVVESDREVPLPDAWRVLKLKKYGTTVVTLTSPEIRSLR
jgi:16S rRNA (guanine966-N2)-methyltransferase